MTLRDSLLALVIILVWGVNFVVIALGLDGMPPLLMGGLRFLLVAIIGCWFVARPKVPLSWVFGYALTLGFAQFAFLFTAMAVGMPAGLASLVLQSQALFTLIFAFLILKEQVRAPQVLAILVAGAGLALIGLSNNNGDMTVIGFTLTLVAACSWAVGNLVTRSISQRGYKADVNLVIWSAWVSCAPFFILSYFIEGPDLIIQTLVNISWVSVASLSYLALIATIIGYSLWSYLLSRYPAGQVAPLTLGVPVVGLASASVFLGEQISQLQLLGISIVMLGLVINMRLDKLLKKLLFSTRSADAS
ncbi:O-acetylserine/cysteine exporter ['Osedax' symbiont bacterium Rs2_46_30_T18]|nr:O-acetylserine/cysteine exporter ['Osedax' symbiont bacterium Rs2_46_30_T18]